MLLQLALDFLGLEEALALSALTVRFVDILEIGTPLLLREGSGAIRAMRTLHPETRILADGKIVDGGYGEAKMLFDAGADLVTVLAVASGQTLAAVHTAAKERGGTVAADMIASSDIAGDLRKVAASGIDLVCVHRAADSGSWESENSRLLEKISAAAGAPRIMVAGGISLETIPSILPLGPDIVVVGSAVTGAPDPAQAAESLRTALRRRTP